MYTKLLKPFLHIVFIITCSRNACEQNEKILFDLTQHIYTSGGPDTLPSETPLEHKLRVSVNYI